MKLLLDPYLWLAVAALIACGEIVSLSASRRRADRIFAELLARDAMRVALTR